MDADSYLVAGIAYGEAAEIVLEVALKPMPKLCALVAYYPERLPAPTGAGYPPSLGLIVHLAGSQPMAPKFHSYSYPDAEPGFAENDLDQFDKVSAALAWTRTLTLVRKGFEIEVDLEAIWEQHTACRCHLATALLVFRSLEWTTMSNYQFLPVVSLLQSHTTMRPAYSCKKAS